MIVIAGIHKKRAIPFNNKRYGNAETTPQKVKGAIFSIIGEDLTGKHFLDLYGCSGQIGLEAISRNAAMVVINEMDRKRYEFISSIKERWEIGNTLQLANGLALKCVELQHMRGISFDYIFLDPPYERKNGEPETYDAILDALGRFAVLKPDGMIIVQHFHKRTVIIPDVFKLLETRDYGSNSLSFIQWRSNQ